MTRRRFAVLLVSVLVSLSGLVLGGLRVVALERAELEERSPSRTLAEWSRAEGATHVSARLLSVRLHRDEQATFEVCSENTPDDAQLKDALTFVVWRPALQKLELSVPLSAKYLALLTRKGREACLVLGGGLIEHDGDYALDAVWGRAALPPQLLDLKLRARALAKQPLSRNEGLMVALVALGALSAALALYAPGGTFSARFQAKRALAIVPLGVFSAAVGFASLLFLPLSGALGGLVRGVLIGAGEIGIATLSAFFLFAMPAASGSERRARLLRGLGLMAPDQRPGPFLFAAVLAAALLVPLARGAMSLVPSTGEAPLEAFIAWPSGALCFALIGMLVPCAEELFFRGFVYGALSAWHKPIAFTASVSLFALAHAQQSFGNWGALLAVTCTGLMMTTLRALSGSTLIPAVAHVLYNASLWRSSFDH